VLRAKEWCVDAETKAYLEQLIGQATARLDRIETRLDSIQEQMLTMKAEIGNLLHRLEQRLDLIETTLRSMEIRFPGISASLIDLGKNATTAERRQQDLASRVAKLEELVEQLRKPAA
jgi:archaellum component FlaC